MLICSLLISQLDLKDLLNSSIDKLYTHNPLQHYWYFTLWITEQLGENHEDRHFKIIQSAYPFVLLFLYRTFNWGLTCMQVFNSTLINAASNYSCNRTCVCAKLFPHEHKWRASCQIDLLYYKFLLRSFAQPAQTLPSHCFSTVLNVEMNSFTKSVDITSF